MFAVLDACAFINLLQAYEEDDLFDLIESEFIHVSIAEDRVVKEIHTNKYINLLMIDASRKQKLDEIIYHRVRKYINEEDTQECQQLIRRATNYSKSNGEFYSAALCLYQSRMGDEKRICGPLLEVHLITDDLGVSDDFGEFFRINEIGTIIDTIDIMTILYLRGRITKQKLEAFCSSLMALYSRKFSELKSRIKVINQAEGDPKISSLFTRVWEILDDDDDVTLWRNVRRENNYRQAKRRYPEFFETLEHYFSNDESRYQIARIKERRQKIEHVWYL